MKCVLFDLDGTVADTEVLKAKAISLATQEFGVPAPPMEIYKSVMGQSWEVATKAFFEYAGTFPEMEKFNPVFREKYALLIDSELVQNPAVLKFIDFLKSRETKIGLVSSSSPWMIQKVLSKIQMSSVFDTVVSNADATKHKPHPEAYLVALQRLGVQASDAIAFEDSEPGFQAASAAGMPVYGIHHSYNQSHSFSLCRGTIKSFNECLSWDIFKN